MPLQLNIASKSALLCAIRTYPGKFAVLIGSALSYDKQGRGVPSVSRMIDLMREVIRQYPAANPADFEEEIRQHAGADAYQAGMQWIQENIHQDAVNRVIQTAVLQARVSPTAWSEAELCDKSPSDWYLPPGTADLGYLLATGGLAGPVLTVNFDTLVEQAITTAGGEAQSVAVDRDKGLPNKVEYGNRILVAHLHGHWLQGDTLHTGAQLQADRKYLKGSLSALLRDRAIIVIGYGGWNDAFVDALFQACHDPDAKMEVLWCFHQQSRWEIEHMYADLLKKMEDARVRGRFRCYVGIDCHTIFAELRAALSMPVGTVAPARTATPVTVAPSPQQTSAVSFNSSTHSRPLPPPSPSPKQTETQSKKNVPMKMILTTSVVATLSVGALWQSWPAIQSRLDEMKQELPGLLAPSPAPVGPIQVSFPLRPEAPPVPVYPEKLILSPSTSEDETSNTNTWTSLKRHLNRALMAINRLGLTQMPTKVEIASHLTNQQQLKGLAEKTIQIAVLSTGTTITAWEKYGARPIAELRDENGNPLTYEVAVIVNPSTFPNADKMTVSQVMEALNNNKSLRFCFGEQTSNSGFRVPYIIMKLTGVDPQRFLAAPDYKQSPHSSTVLAVANGDYDVAFVAGDVLQRTPEYNTGRVKVITAWNGLETYTPPGASEAVTLKGPFPSACICVSADLPAPMVELLRAALGDYVWSEDTHLIAAYHDMHPGAAGFWPENDFWKRWQRVVEVNALFEKYAAGAKSTDNSTGAQKPNPAPAGNGSTPL